MSSAHDPADIPILAELEVEFARLVAQRLAEDAAEAPGTAPIVPRRPAARPAPAPAPPARRLHLRTGQRILRRAALVGALIGVVGASALAAKSVVERGHDRRSSVVLKHDATHGLTVRRYRGRLCLDIAADSAVATRCASDPRATAVAALSAVSPDGSGGRVVAGFTGARVARVRIAADGHATAVATHPLHGATGGRWFAVTLAAPDDGRRPGAATVTPLGVDGAPAGPVAIDCSLGTAASCRAATGRARRAGTLERPLVNSP